MHLKYDLESQKTLTMLYDENSEFSSKAVAVNVLFAMKQEVSVTV